MDPAGPPELSIRELTSIPAQLVTVTALATLWVVPIHRPAILLTPPPFARMVLFAASDAMRVAVLVVHVKLPV